jgi:hypothetical protein
MVLNPFPMTLHIQDIIVDGDDGDAGLTWIKWWDPATAKYSDKAYWVSGLLDHKDDSELGYAGWGDFDYWYPIEKTFDVGGGFWFCPFKDNVTICMPNPFYVKPEEK